MYLGYGGQFFGPDNKRAISGEAGVKTLETMKKLTAYMDPEYLTMDSSALQKQFQGAAVWKPVANPLNAIALERIVTRTQHWQMLALAFAHGRARFLRPWARR